jgi:hypothetical protein
MVVKAKYYTSQEHITRHHSGDACDVKEFGIRESKSAQIVDRVLAKRTVCFDDPGVYKEKTGEKY